MIEVSHLTRCFAQRTVVDDLEFSVRAGEVVGFLGPNGAGKSTTMRMLTGFLPPSAGTARICDLDIRKQTRKAQRCIGYLPEGAPSYDDMSVRGFLKFIASMRGLSRRLTRERMGYVVEKLELQTVLGQSIETLSRGFRRRVGIAQAILHNPPVLLLDEPTDGLDPNQKRHIRELVSSLADERVVMLSTHILEEVSAMCSRAIVLTEGRIVADASPTELESRSRYHQAVDLVVDGPPDLISLAVLPGVAGIESGAKEGQLTVLARPGSQILPQINQLVATRGWNARFSLRRGCLEDVFTELTRGANS